jgi:hypothetical protein
MNHHDHLLTFVNRLVPLNDPTTLQTLPQEHIEPILALAMLNLEPLRPHLHKLYPALLMGAPRRAPWDPIVLFRALLLSSCLAIRSPHRLHERLLEHPVLALACSFEPPHIPSVTTFYDFIHRIIRTPPPPHV